ncbi:MAG: prophage tail fiber N-terminal domain-containing protein, partial [Plesiomonas shigelloides]
MYSKILISGRLVEPADDKPRSGVTLILSSVKNSSVVLKHATYRCVTGGNGEYSFKAAPGTYAVAVSVYGAEPERVGQIRVYSDSLPGDLNTFLMAPAEDDLTPEIIRLVDNMRSEAVKAAGSAKQSEQVTSTLASDVATHAKQVASNKVVVEQKTTIATDAAATAVAAKEQTSKDAVATGKDRLVTQTKAQEAAASANAAKAAQDSIVEDAADVRDKALQVANNTVLVANNASAVQLNTEQVAQNTQTVTTKTYQVSENAQAVAANTRAVTQMRDEVVAKTSMAQAAADTATQKAASAAGHDAAAAEYARQAQEAAQATAGALIDGGAAD